MKRTFDFLLSFICLFLLLPFLALIAIAIKLTSQGPVVYWSERVGRGNCIFAMPKLRTMQVGAPVLATRHMGHPGQYLTPIGSFLRRTSLDEVPQLWCILTGDMSFVGPRPVLVSETDLLSLRRQEGVDCLTPGLTGWAQINGRDLVTIAQKVAYEKEYMQRQSFLFDLYIILLTIPNVLAKTGISH